MNTAEEWIEGATLANAANAARETWHGDQIALEIAFMRGRRTMLWYHEDPGMRGLKDHAFAVESEILERMKDLEKSNGEIMQENKEYAEYWLEKMRQVAKGEKDRKKFSFSLRSCMSI